MPETLVTDLQIISLVREVPCDISVSELREKAASCINMLLAKYSANEYPLLRGKIENMKDEYQRLIESSLIGKKVFWFLHIYLCFYAHPNTPLHPKTPSEKGFLNYWMHLYQEAKTKE